MFFAYILQSESTGRFYVGSTEDLEKRLTYHNTGQSHYTARQGPWKLVHFEAFDTRSGAVNREKQIKGWKSARMIAQLIADQ